MILFAMIQWGLLTAWIASSKQRNVAAWFGIGAMLPLIGLVLLFVGKPERRRFA